MAAGVGTTVFEEDFSADGFGNDQVNDIFGDDDDIFNAPAPLPPLSPTRIDDGTRSDLGRAEGQGDDQDGEKKKKRVIKRSPRPRLNEARLCAERGIPALAHLCDDIKFKGKGHEASDLKVLLQHFEHWAHRLYPMYPFEDVIEQVESLGKKKLVQNAIKQARRGDDGLVNENASDDEMQVNGQDSIGSTPSTDNANFGGHVEASSTPVIGLTPEQKERIRLNRERALAKRKNLQPSQPSNSTSQTTSQDNMNTSNQVGSQNSRDETNDLPSDSPERGKLDFESDWEKTQTVEKMNIGGDTRETEVTGNKETMETEVAGGKETMETEVAGGKETMETEVAVGKETMETEVTGDKETMEREGTGDKETMETEVAGGKETMETEVTGDKETMETEVTGDKETMERESTGDKETMETEGTWNKETMETAGTGNKVTMETECTWGKESMETEISVDKETVENDTTQNKKTTETPETKQKEIETRVIQ